MDEILKKSHIFILIAVLIGAAAFLSRPTYAGGAFSEVPYAVKSAGYSSSSDCGIVTIKWSKAYSRLKDGSIEDVSGYEIMYTFNDDLEHAKTVRKGKDATEADIKLKDLNTPLKYSKYIDRFDFRVRSFKSVNGRKSYSKWASADYAKPVKIYAPVTLSSIKADRNEVTAEWERVANADGYIVYGKKAGSTRWEERAVIEKPKDVDFTDKDLEYSCEYTYSVVSYKTRVSAEPGKLNTSYLKLLGDTKNNVYKVKTGEFGVDVPTVRAVFSGTDLEIMWHHADGAADYTIQMSKDPEFKSNDTRTFEISHDMLPVDEEMQYYTMERDDVDRDDYYVRARAAGTYKKRKYVSDWSETKFAEFGAGTYRIVFDGNGATSGDMDTVVVGTTEEYELPNSKYSRDGYKFSGWCLEKNNDLFLDAEQPIRYGMPQYVPDDKVKELAESGDEIKLYACWQGSGAEAAADWASTIAADDEFVYGPVVKNHCWFCQGGDKYYVCNAFIAAAYTHGMPYFDGYVAGNTRWDWWVKKGFKDIGENVPMSEIKKGDIISCWVKKKHDWGHIIMAVTDGTDENPRIAHAASVGMDDRSIREDPMEKRLSKYAKYHVVRYVG